MEMIQLSKRLAAAASYIPKSARLADIGSDHAYLPVALVQNQAIEFAVAGEVVKGPFEKAKNEVSSRKLEKVIDVRLGNGLEVISADDLINTVSICGMGGALIRDILNRGLQQEKLLKKEKLILQPNVGEKTLRTFLMQQQYKITAEEIVEENDKIYEIIVAEPSDQVVNYTDLELMFGPELLKERTDIFKEKWRRELDKLAYIQSELKKSTAPNMDKTQKIEREAEQIREVIK